MNVLTLLAASLVLLTCSGLSRAEESRTVRAAQEKLKATFASLSFTDFRPSPVPGLFEVNVGGRIIYFHPEAETLFFGEIFSKDGRSLTAESISSAAAAVVDQLPLHQAVVVGPEDGIPIIEFTDPDCPYCRLYHQYVTGIRVPVKRLIFFETRGHQSARAKAIHVLCSADPASAFLELYDGKAPAKYEACDQGTVIFEAHAAAARRAGVNATPTFILDQTPVTGFRQEVIARHIAERSQSVAHHQGD